jgi:hypothetical protein
MPWVTTKFQDKVKIILQAVVVTEAYHAGYCSAPSPHTLKKRIKLHKCKHCQLEPVKIEDVFENKSGLGQMKWYERIEKEFPNHLHNMFRHVTKIIGNDASVHHTIHYMNKKSKADFPFCPTRRKLALTEQNFWSWFHSNNDSMKSPKPKPNLTPLHCKQHLKFSRKWREVIRNKKIRYCFLDEKWFYTRSNQNKLKVLPPSMFEQPKDAHCHAPKVRSR